MRMRSGLVAALAVRPSRRSQRLLRPPSPRRLLPREIQRDGGRRLRQRGRRGLLPAQEQQDRADGSRTAECGRVDLERVLAPSNPAVYARELNQSNANLTVASIALNTATEL